MTQFHDLYQRYAPDVYRFAFWLAGDAHDAEEITAETFARAFTARDKIQSATVKGYLLTCARNVYLESKRKRRVQVELDAELADPAQRHDHRTEQRDEIRAVMGRLKLLPAEDRDALLLRADGLSYDEIATALKITLTSAKVKVHRARAKLLKWREGL